MAITAGVATKAGLGLGVLGAGATTVYFGGDYIINNSLSKYEKALINFLNADKDNDFVFEVKKNGNTDLADTDIVFTSSGDASQNVVVSAKVQLTAGSGSTSIFKKGSSAADTEHLTGIKALGESWTWECEFKFQKKGANVSENDIKDTYKDSIFKTGNKGLFGILKKDLSNYTGGDGKWTKGELKQVKIDFISQCGYQRGVSENRKINKEQNSTPSKVEVPAFNFVKDKDPENKLIPEETERFRYWFEEDYGKKEYKS